MTIKIHIHNLWDAVYVSLKKWEIDSTYLKNDHVNLKKENEKKIKETMKRINMTKIELLKNPNKTNIWQNQSKKWHKKATNNTRNEKD